MKDNILNLIKDKNLGMLEGAVEYAYQCGNIDVVEYAYQCGNIDVVEYDSWREYIREVEFKKTSELLMMCGSQNIEKVGSDGFVCGYGVEK